MSNKYYLDCEFDGHNGPLLSLALVSESGESIHIRTTEFAHDPWVRENVLPLMKKHQADKSVTVRLNEVGEAIRNFLGSCELPVIIADSPVDIGRFCRAISTDSDNNWCSAGWPAITFEVHNVDCYPTILVGAVQHNAWWDAMALKQKLEEVF